MRIVFVSAALMAFLVGGCGTGRSSKADFDFSTIDKIAVVDVAGVVGSELIEDRISELFTMELSERGYVPVEQAEMKDTLKAEATDPDTAAVEAGKILEVPVVLVVDVPTFGEEMSVTAKMIDVNDGHVLWTGSGSGKTGRSLSDIVGGRFGGGFLEIGPESETTGPTSSDVLASMPGYTLAPKEAKNVQKIIKKACKSLPHNSAPKKARRRKLWFLPLPGL
ncbi:MAG: hypothetical protein JSU70_02330 [Phycisphaerales bacterium]|nr:MAG: hypothetical protein JSU70_02330 [Phycisphaerales bacterium]